MELRKTTKIFFAAGMLVALIAIVVGFSLLGSPWHQRKIRSDDRRLQDIQQIASAIYNYQRSESFAGKPNSGLKTTSTIPLPISLEAFQEKANLSPGPTVIPTPMKDPVTGAPYEYRVVDPSRIELCANFETSNKGECSQNKRSTFWEHAAGRGCFIFNMTEYPSYWSCGASTY